MDWIRRNWPDLLIGFALLAVISGIVATLLTGGSFFPGQNQSTSAQTTRPPAQESQPQQAQQDPAGQVAAEVPPGDQPPTQEQAGVVEDGPVDPFAEAAAEQAAEAARADTIDPLELPSVVALRPGADPETATQTPATQAPADTPAQESAQQPQETPAQTQAPAAISGQLPSSSVPYTVGVGAFRDQGNAERQANVFRQAGYPVVVASQDDFTVVLLGPYSSRSEADRISGDVSTGGFGVSPIVYTYQGDGETQQAGTSEQAPAAASQQPATTEQPVTAQEPATAATDPQPAATATAAGRYLQVGAYSSSDNASAQAGQLEQLGYDVVQEQDGNLIRVLVGPFGDGQLTGARDRLAAQGIDSVPR